LVCEKAHSKVAVELGPGRRGCAEEGGEVRERAGRFKSGILVVWLTPQTAPLYLANLTNNATTRPTGILAKTYTH